MSEVKQVAYIRGASFERTAVDREQRTAKLTFSSETPVARSFGVEILDHTPSSVRLGRINSGAPLLWRHDDKSQGALLGIIESASVGEDRRGYALVRFGRSPEAERALNDVEDGILRNVSVGYFLHDTPQAERGAGGEKVFRFKDWEPYEISLLPVPADTAVGVGRGIEFTPPVEANEVQPAAPAANSAVIEVRGMAEETQVRDDHKVEIARRDRIIALASDKEFSRFVTSADAREAIEKGTSADAFAESISRKMVTANDASKVGTAGDNVMRDLGKDAKRYSLVRAHRALIRGAQPGAFGKEDDQLEREVSEEIGKRLGKQTLGMFVPNSVERTVTASATGSGLTAQTAVVSTVTESALIEMYRNRARVLALGATRLGGLSGIVRLPRQTGAGTAQWLAETAATTASDVTTDYVAITPKRLSMQNKYTVELLAESSVDVENMLANDRSKVLNLAIDLAALNGATGGANPVGVLQTSGLATITSTGTALTSTGKALSYIDYLAFESTVAAANADVATSGWMVTPEVRGLAKGTPMFAAGYAMPIWNSSERSPDGLEVGPLGYKAGVTNQLPKNLTANSVNNLHAVVFGDWAQVIVADYGASELIVDPYTNAGNGIFVVTERALLDVEIRHVSAFAACLTAAVA